MLGQNPASRYIVLDPWCSSGLWPIPLSAVIFTNFCRYHRNGMIFYSLPFCTLSSPFLQQPFTAFDLLSKHQWLVAGGAFTASLIDWKLTWKVANKPGIDLSFILNDRVFFRKTLGIPNLQTCKIL